MAVTFTPGGIVPADAAAIERAGRLIREGGLVGMPTETVYGLAADATNGLAVAAIFEAKGRPLFNPLISHVASLAEARRHGVFGRDAERLAEAFWPGPLTLVVPHREGSPISDLARAGLDTVALRVPAHPVARDLISAGRTAARRAIGQPFRPDQPDRSGPCRRRAWRQRRSHPRWRTMRSGPRIDSRRLPWGQPGASAPRRHHAIRDRDDHRPNA